LASQAAEAVSAQVAEAVDAGLVEAVGFVVEEEGAPSVADDVEGNRTGAVSFDLGVHNADTESPEVVEGRIGRYAVAVEEFARAVWRSGP